jgi:hypothetical protein
LSNNIDDVFKAHGVEPPLINVKPSPLTKIVNRKNIRKNPIEATHTTQQATGIENALIELLNGVVVVAKEEFEDNPQNYNDLTVRQNIESEVSDSMRAATESFYGLANAYVNRANRTNGFLTSRDVDNIKKIADDSTLLIMQKFDDYFRREEQIKNQVDYITPLKAYMDEVGGELITTAGSINTVRKLNSFQLDKNVKNIIANTSTRAISMGTIDKARQMINPSIPSPVITSRFGGPSLQVLMKSAAKFAELNLSTQDIWNAGFQPAEYVPRSVFLKKTGQLRDLEDRPMLRHRDEYAQWGMWTTAEDDYVCFEYCVPLEGEVFNMLEFDSPVPGSLEGGTHPSCRCRYLLVDPYDLAMSNVIWG